MQKREVVLARGARIDYLEIVAFVYSVMSPSGALRYSDGMRAEIQTLSHLADCWPQSRSKQLLRIHPQARRMVSHNRKWQYVFHIEDSFVVIDRILPAKMVKE